MRRRGRSAPHSIISEWLRRCQNAAGAVFFRPEFYDAAFASSGCHDNRMDKIWWNEQWMGEMGPHYEASSNVTAARNLKGAPFLAVGELGTNVDPASTTQVPGNGLEFSDGPPPPSEDFFVRPFAGDPDYWWWFVVSGSCSACRR